jgi:hypothetical protein
MHGREGRVAGKRRGSEVPWRRRILPKMPAGMKNSGERFARPGGVVEKGEREGRERSGRALIGTGESLKRRGFMRD